jgi:hypothetical protein
MTWFEGVPGDGSLSVSLTNVRMAAFAFPIENGKLEKNKEKRIANATPARYFFSCGGNFL